MLALIAFLAVPQGLPPLDDKELAEILAPIREKQGVPALAAAVVYKGKIIAKAAVGVRKWGDPTPVTFDDTFHMGSLTKSMTATMIARLVHEKKLTWDETPYDAFPEMRPHMADAFRKVTLRMLLSHRSGLTANFQPANWGDLGDQYRDPSAARRKYVEAVLAQPPPNEPGQAFLYSNTGYVVAAEMAEKATGRTWEDLIVRYVFKPLGMKSVGFGPMGTPGKVDEPWQHRLVDGKPFPIENRPTADNPPVISPAGRVHCSIGDLARYVKLHLDGEAGRSKLLPAADFKLLHTAQFGGDYAFGWIVVDRAWADGRALFHNGSNNMNYAAVWMAPSRDFGAVAACNMAGREAENAVDQAVSAAVRRVLAK